MNYIKTMPNRSDIQLKQSFLGKVLQSAAVKTRIKTSALKWKVFIAVKFHDN